MTKVKEENFLKTLDFLIEQSGLEEGPVNISLMIKAIDYWCTRCPKTAFVCIVEKKWDELKAIHDKKGIVEDI